MYVCLSVGSDQVPDAVPTFVLLQTRRATTMLVRITLDFMKFTV